MKVGILIGRFQVPEPHEGHRFLINRILEQCDMLLILIGSANSARTIKNPYTFLERKKALLNTIKSDKLLIAPLNDYLYNNAQWMADVVATIQHYTSCIDLVTMYGHFKEGNDYLKWFPQFKYSNIESEIELSGSEIRNNFKHLLPASVLVDLEYAEKEKKQFSAYPYPDSLNVCCGDAVVECLGHILLVKRGRSPGIGNWALPGGHKHTKETFLQCILRELLEETNLRVPEKVLVGSIVSEKLFDSPTRSGALPKITLAVHFSIKPNSDGTLPRISPSDDAVEAKWTPLNEAVNSLVMHDDHRDIISTMIGIMPQIAYLNPSIQP